MKRNFKRYLSLALIGLSLASCGNKAGEVIKLNSQLDTLTELNKGTLDAAIIDSVMAGYYTANGDFKNKLVVVPDLILTTEQYGIATRKSDVALIDKINEGLAGVLSNGKLKEIANYFGVTSSLLPDASYAYTSLNATDNSFDEIVSSNKIVIGYTVFAPIAYTDTANNYANNSFTGFDTELAREVIAYLNNKYEKNIQVEFQEIDWDSKESLLSSGTIDLIWNGLTINDQRKEQLSISIPYLNNNQVVVVNKDDVNKYKDKEALKKATIGVEDGSAGEDVAKDLIK